MRLASSQKPQHLHSSVHEGSAYFRNGRAGCRTIRDVVALATDVRMAALLRDRYFEYLPDRAWDLVTGESVQHGAVPDDDRAAGHPSGALAELLEHGIDGTPRWVTATTTANWSRQVRLIAAEARRRGYVAIAADVFLRA